MPFETLDDENLSLLLERTRWWVKSDAAGLPRSDNEAKAMRIVEVALLHRLQLDKLDAGRVMRKLFCDICDCEISTSLTTDRINDSTVLRRSGNQETVNIEIVCGLGIGKWNSGDLCRSCLFDALDRFDPRPKVEAA